MNYLNVMAVVLVAGLFSACTKDEKPRATTVTPGTTLSETNSSGRTTAMDRNPNTESFRGTDPSTGERIPADEQLTEAERRAKYEAGAIPQPLPKNARLPKETPAENPDKNTHSGHPVDSRQSE